MRRISLSLIVVSFLGVPSAREAGAQAGGPAQGASFSAVTSAAPLQWSPASRGEVTVTVTTYDRPEAVGIAASGSQWPGHKVLGEPLRLGNPVLDGPGTTTSFLSSGFGVLPGACIRGAFQQAISGVLVRLPAYTQTTLRYPVSLSAPPWPGTDYTPSFHATIPYDGSVKFPARVTFSAPAFGVTGRSGVHIALSTPLTRRKGHRYITIPHGGSILIRGATNPVLRHHQLRLTYRALRGPTLVSRRIGAVRTNGRGRFAYRWRPSGSGLYGVFAHYTSDDPSLLSDTGCGLEVYEKQR